MHELYLRLRGGGSSSKRKEARKRKFAHSDLESWSTKHSKPPNLAQGTNDPDVKRLKTKNHSLLQEAPLEQDERAARSDGQTFSIDKPQRFICFVGGYLT